MIEKRVDIALTKSRGRARWPLPGPVPALLVFFASAAVSVGEETCPAHLFVIARSKNANIVAYDANRNPADEWDASEPVVAYWLLNGENDQPLYEKFSPEN